MSDLATTTVIGIREHGRDEIWLRDVIYKDPSILGLGELTAVGKELSQPQGGRLDLLLKNPEDDQMYEVELQLGKTDESHIIRTIEYWDQVRRQWPRRSHTAVLVAEEITHRFFNVVQLLSASVPVIGIRANLVKVGDQVALHFTKIIDSYEEPEDQEPNQRDFEEQHWVENDPRVLECAKWYRELLTKAYGPVAVKYFENYIAMTIAGIQRVWIDRRKNGRAFFSVKFVESDFASAVDYLTKSGFSFVPREAKSMLTFNVDLQQLKNAKSTHEWIVARLAPSHLLTAGK